MLEFVYDLVYEFVPRSLIKILYMDTDSLYAAYGAPGGLEDCVPPEGRKAFYEIYRNFFPSPVCDGHWDDYVRYKTTGGEGRSPGTDCVACDRRRAYDRRTPGLFKVEFEGEEFVGLCSKTYYCSGYEAGSDKSSSKGVQKKRNAFSASDYRSVLTTQKRLMGMNMGFRAGDGRVYTYTQHKQALTYFYPKRRVHADSVSTSPLAL